MRAKFMTVYGCLALLTAAITVTGQTSGSSAAIGGAPPALALVILYDGSGSMANKVPNLNGEPTPKYQLANNAVRTIAQKMENYRTNKNVAIDAGLVYFTQGTIKVGIPFQMFRAPMFESWARSFQSPNGGTPLGEGIKKANQMLAESHALKKHILIVTDGESNRGETPQSVLRRMKDAQDSTSVYFVAFDVSAKVFDPVKKLGATVVSAANESELKSGIDNLLGKRILLEAE
jgi:hypothetical protein